MNLQELRKAISNITRKDLSFHLTYELWDWYDYKIIWQKIYIQIDKKNTSAKRDFISIIRSNEDILYSPLSVNTLWWEDSLRWLYHHHPYWPNNNSNCVLVCWKQVVAVQYNWLENWSTIYTECYIPNYIILNNKKKIEWNYKLNDEFYNLIKEICAELQL